MGVPPTRNKPTRRPEKLIVVIVLGLALFLAACGWVRVDELGPLNPDAGGVGTEAGPSRTHTPPGADTDSGMGDDGDSSSSDTGGGENTEAGTEQERTIDSGSDAHAASDTASVTASTTDTRSGSTKDGDTVSETDSSSNPDGGVDAGAEDAGDGASRSIFGYYMGYQSWGYPGDAVDFDSLTHLIVGRLVPRADGTLSSDFDMDDVAGPAMAQDMVGRTHAAGRTAILLIDLQDEAVWLEAASEPNRLTLVASISAAAQTYGFDGIDLAWAPSGEDGFLLLVTLAQDLRRALPGVSLSFAIGWVGSTQSVPPYTASTAEHFDQMFVATLGMGNSWSGWQSWHNSPLYGDTPSTPSSVETTVQKLVDAGIPAEKIHISLPFFGSCWEGVTDPMQDGGTYLLGDNAMSYVNIMTDYYPVANRYTWDDTARVPYLSFEPDPGPQGCTFVSYDNPQSIREKGAFIRDTGLGGAFIWTLAQGYLPDHPVGERNPLLTAAAQSILAAP